MTLHDDGIQIQPRRTVPGQAWMAKAVQSAAEVFRVSETVRMAACRLREEAQAPRSFELFRGRLRFRPGQKTYLVQQPCEALTTWGTQSSFLTWLSDQAGGSVPALHSAHLWYALVPPAGWTPTMSQTWHRDPYEEGMDRIVKVFWYLEDVDGGNGPFEYLRGTQERTKPTGSALTDRYIRERQPGALDDHPSRTVVTGPQDTVIVADTSGIHRGGFCLTHPRLSATLVYGFQRAKPVWRNHVDCAQTVA